MTTGMFDFPEIESPPEPTPAPAAARLPAVAAPPATVAVVPTSIKDAVLAQFKAVETDITSLAEQYRGVAFDVATTKGMNEAKAARLELREKGRYALLRAEKSVKADVNDLKRVMADEVERLVGIVQPVEDAVDAQIKAEEERKAAEKAERERIEAERVAAHQARLAKIGAYLTHCQQHGMTAARIEAGIAMLAKATFGPEWQEFESKALAAQVETLQAMRDLHAQVVEREAEEIRLEAQRQEQARIAEQQAEAAREIERQRAELLAQQKAAEAKAAVTQALQRWIAEIHAAATGHAGKTAAELAVAIAEIERLDVSESRYHDLTPQAVAARDSTLAALVGLRDVASAREAYAAAERHDEQAAQPGALSPATQGGVVENPTQSQPVAPFPAGDETVEVGAVSEGAATPITTDTAAANVSEPMTDLLGDPIVAAAPAGDELAQCREALALALELLDQLICKPPTKKQSAGLFARVDELRAMGGLARNTTTTTTT